MATVSRHQIQHVFAIVRVNDPLKGMRSLFQQFLGFVSQQALAAPAGKFHGKGSSARQR
jgi:hypothetical protein